MAAGKPLVPHPGLLPLCIIRAKVAGTGRRVSNQPWRRGCGKVGTCRDVVEGVWVLVEEGVEEAQRGAASLHTGGGRVMSGGRDGSLAE